MPRKRSKALAIDKDAGPRASRYGLRPRKSAAKEAETPRVTKDSSSVPPEVIGADRPPATQKVPAFVPSLQGVSQASHSPDKRLKTGTPAPTRSFCPPPTGSFCPPPTPQLPTPKWIFEPSGDFITLPLVHYRAGPPPPTAEELLERRWPGPPILSTSAGRQPSSPKLKLHNQSIFCLTHDCRHPDCFSTMSARGDAARRGTDDGDAAGGPAFQSVGPVPEHTHQAGDKRPAGDELFNNYPPSQRRSDPPYSNERSHRENSTGRARNPRLSPYANANRPRARKREPGQRYRSASPATHLPPSIRPRTPPAPERPTRPTVYPIQLAPIVNPNIRPDSPLRISTMWTYEEALPPSASGILHYPPAPAPPAIPPRPATRAESNMNTVETESRDTFNPPPTASALSFCQDPNCDQVHMGDPCTDPSCTDNHDRVPGPVHSQPNGHQSHTSPYPRPSSAAPYPHQAPTHPSQAQPYPPQVSPYPPQRRSYPAQRAPYPPHPQAQAQGSQPPVYGPQSAYPPPQQMYPPGAGHYPVHPSHNPNFPHSAPPTTQHRGSMMHAQPPPLGLPGNNVGEAPNRRGGSRMGRARNQSSTPDAHHQPQPGPSYGASVPVCLACWVTRFPGPNVLFERLYTSTEWGDRNVFCSQCGDKGRWKTNYP